MPAEPSRLRVLTVNAGSSSLKLSTLDGDDKLIATTELAAPDSRFDSRQLAEALAGELADAEIVAHRIVHGGERFRSAAIVDSSVVRELRALSELAPLHQGHGLDALDAVSRALPDLPAVVCFDTAFHATLPPAASTYALPAAWRERWPLRRFGFHGLSHAWIARRVPELLSDSEMPLDDDLRIVSAHLGSGASLCAVAAGRSVDTTMGFTPLEGLVMATRSGSVDPGLLLWLLQTGRATANELADALEHESGLRGLAGSDDIRDALAAAAVDSGGVADRARVDRARLTLDVYAHRLSGAIAQMAASLGGLHVLAFTGGIGQHIGEVRARAVESLGFMGIALDPQRNASSEGEADVSMAGATVRTLVIPAREDLEMARQARAAVAQ
jgi:acetate kinase